MTVMDPELKLAYALRRHRHRRSAVSGAGSAHQGCWASRRSCAYFPPIVTGPMIIMIGLNLAPAPPSSNASTCWWLALVAMAIIVVANIWGKGMVKIIPILLGVVGAYIVAVIANACGAQLPGRRRRHAAPRSNFASVGEAHLIGLPEVHHSPSSTCPPSW